MAFKRKAPLQSKTLLLKITPEFKKGLEYAASVSLSRSVSAFVRQAVVDQADKYGVKIRLQKAEGE